MQTTDQFGALSQATVSIAFQDLDQWPHYSKYETLDQTKEEIRILTILPGWEAQGIKCTLERVPLHNAGAFYALSYRWGTATGTKSVKIDDEQVCIRKNLWLSLWSLRQVHGSIRLWVDFLCINQRNVHERNWQVKLMANIYSSADGVIAWLGDATAKSDAAFDFLDKTRDLRRRKTKSSVIQRGEKSRKRALKDLMDREYWSRLWIIQEVLLAQNLWIMAGSRSTDWDTLRYLTRPSQTAAKGSDEQSATRQIFKSIWKLKNQKATTMQMNELVFLFHAALCQDPRDRLYGFLALVDESIRARVRIDYGDPVLQVFVENYELLSGSTGWCPQETSNPPSETIHDPHFFIENMSTVYSNSISELNEICQNEALRSQLTTNMTFRAQYQCHQTLFYTFAAVDASQSRIMHFTRFSASSGIQYDVYISGVTIERPYFEGRSVVYTTALPENGDILFHLTSMVIVLRPAKMGTVVIGTGVTVRCDGRSLPDPRKWFAGRIPDALFSLIPDSWSEPSLPHDSAACHVRLNGPAIAEMVRCASGPEVKLTLCQRWEVWRFLGEHGLSKEHSQSWNYEEKDWGLLWPVACAVTDPKIGPPSQDILMSSKEVDDTIQGHSTPHNAAAFLPAVVNQKRKRESTSSSQESNKFRKISTSSSATGWRTPWSLKDIWSWLTWREPSSKVIESRHNPLSSEDLEDCIRQTEARALSHYSGQR